MRERRAEQPCPPAPETSARPTGLGRTSEEEEQEEGLLEVGGLSAVDPTPLPARGRRDGFQEEGGLESQVEGLSPRAGSWGGVFILLFISVRRAILGPSDPLLSRK